MLFRIAWEDFPSDLIVRQMAVSAKGRMEVTEGQRGALSFTKYP